MSPTSAKIWSHGLSPAYALSFTTYPYLSALNYCTCAYLSA